MRQSIKWISELNHYYLHFSQQPNHSSYWPMFFFFLWLRTSNSLHRSLASPLYYIILYSLKHVFQLFNRFVRFSNRRSEQQHIAFTQENLLHGFQSITKLLSPFQGIVLFDLQRQLRILASSYCKLLFPDSRLFYSLPNCRDELWNLLNGESSISTFDCFTSYLPPFCNNRNESLHILCQQKWWFTHSLSTGIIIYAFVANRNNSDYILQASYPLNTSPDKILRGEPIQPTFFQISQLHY